MKQTDIPASMTSSIESNESKSPGRFTHTRHPAGSDFYRPGVQGLATTIAAVEQYLCITSRSVHFFGVLSHSLHDNRCQPHLVRWYQMPVTGIFHGPSWCTITSQLLHKSILDRNRPA